MMKQMVQRARGFIRNRLGIPPPLEEWSVLGRPLRVRAGTMREHPDYDDAWFLACARHAHTIFDIGANVGTHTIAFARFPFPQVTVHAFEAQRIVFQMLAGTIALNALDNVHCHQNAVSSTSGEVIEIVPDDSEEGAR